MRITCLMLLFGAALVAGVPPALARQKTAQPAPTPPSNEDCLMCHGEPSAVGANGRSVAVSPEVFAASIHGQSGVSCVDCHTDLAKVTEFPHPEKLAPVKCATCHEPEAAKYDLSVHAQARRANPGSVAATCADCHGTHDILASSNPDSRTYHLNLPRTCGRCHGNPEIIRRGKIAIGNVYARFQDSIHGQALSQAGLLVAPNCSNCHGAHDILRQSNPQSRVFRLNVPATCGACHQGVELKYEAGIHGTQLRQGNALVPECATCHSAHAIKRVQAESWRLQAIAECGSCHPESARTYRDTFHGQVTSLGFVRVATCADCHRAHDLFPPGDPRSSVNPAHLLQTCQKCHPAATPSFTEYDPHASRENRRRDPALFYAARFMDSLLIFVFAFFGIHTALWFTRSVRRGGGPKQGPTAPTENKQDEHRDQ
jgi:nitrate/TMAO reductase-like tetraheme cytochrome c subunit